MQIAGIGVEVLIALAYLIAGAGEVRRAHRPAGALLICAGVVVLGTTCGWRALSFAGVLSDPTALAALVAVYAGARIVVVGLLVGVALVSLARRLQRLRSPEPQQF